jgi:hypothetical protein
MTRRAEIVKSSLLALFQPLPSSFVINGIALTTDRRLAELPAHMAGVALPL